MFWWSEDKNVTRIETSAFRQKEVTGFTLWSERTM
jgi:hypothetical protein